MGGYVVTEFVEYAVNDEMKAVLKEMVSTQLEPEVFMVDVDYKLRSGPLRAIIFYGGFQNLFYRPTVEQAEKLWGLTDMPLKDARVRESHDMTIVKSRLLHSGLVYEKM